MKLRLYLFLLALTIVSVPALPQSKNKKPRTIITTDGEVDDQDSFIRMLLYANEFDIAGLIYSSSQWHYKGDGKGTRFKSELEMTADRYGERTELRWPGTTWMESLIDRYTLVYSNLIKHAAGYPQPQHLKSMIRIGNIDFEGEMSKDTPGSDYLKKIILDKDESPLYIQIWGGTNTVARALKSIEDQYKKTPDWSKIEALVSHKVILYAVLDQDATYKKYIEPNWPNIRVLYNASQFWNFAYPWPKVVPQPLQVWLRGPWFEENIKFNHGPLLSTYYLWGDGTAIANDPENDQGDAVAMRKNGMIKYDFISEGDSPAYFHLIDVGLGNLENASFGGWGGRMIQSKTNPNRWEDGDNVTDFNPYTKTFDKAYPQTRWIDVLQNDFAARADWCVVAYDKANHPPEVTLAQSNRLEGGPGESVNLECITKDPDGNQVNVKWWQYHEVDTYAGQLDILNSSKQKLLIEIPKDAKAGDTIHLIVEATDNGVPALTRYRRVVINVK